MKDASWGMPSEQSMISSCNESLWYPYAWHHYMSCVMQKGGLIIVTVDHYSTSLCAGTYWVQSCDSSYTWAASRENGHLGIGNMPMFRGACTSVPPDWSLHFMLNGNLDLKILQRSSQDSDQTVWMRRLIFYCLHMSKGPFSCNMVHIFY